MSDVETWKNATHGLVYVLKLDRLGNETHELVNPSKTFTIHKAERLMNQDRAANDKLDHFQNGMLVPVRLLDGDEDAKDIAENPNLLSDSDIQDMFKAHWKTFETKVNAIENEVTLSRLLDVAQAEDTGASVRQLDVIKHRIDEVSPKQFGGMDFVDSEVRSVGRVPGSEAGTPMTPK